MTIPHTKSNAFAVKFAPMGDPFSASDTIVALGAAMDRGDIDSSTLVQRLLARIERAEPVLHAFTRVLGEHALAQARELDAERRAGRVRGPLHGIPVVLKDVIDMVRLPTTGSSRLYESDFATADAAVVRRLIAAGAILLGKTQMTELSFGAWGTNTVMGTPRNPWSLREVRVPGGSSSGSAVAVAAGLALASVNTDTGGSLRIPAALCGMVGLKATPGLIPMDGVMTLSETLDSMGPITRTVSDAGILHAALTGTPRAAEALPMQLRIGILTSRDIDAVHTGALDAYDDCLRYLTDMGARLSEFSLGRTLGDYIERFGVIIGYEAWQRHGLRVAQNPELMDPNVRSRFMAGRAVSQSKYHITLQQRNDSRAEIISILSSFDALLTPTTPMAAPLLSAADENSVTLSRYTRIANYLGLCALSLPARLSAEGLPVAVQLIGKPGRESLLLAIGEELEQRRGPFPAPDLGPLGLP